MDMKGKVDGKIEAYFECGRYFSELLQISTPPDFIRVDDARDRELSIYRSSSKYWYNKARELKAFRGDK